MLSRLSDRGVRWNSRRRCVRCAAIAPLIATLFASAGCQDDVVEEFRAAAAGQLQTGVSALLDGFVEGFFAVLEPNEETTTPAEG